MNEQEQYARWLEEKDDNADESLEDKIMEGERKYDAFKEGQK